MTGIGLLGTATVLFGLGYSLYGRYLNKIFQIDPKAKTPAIQCQDNIDYVPTRAPVLFGHHFASIAGAGPIVGPILGAAFGWIPVALWIIFGCIFIGAVHDFTALMVSIRNEGRSIGHIVEKYISYTGRQIFLIFCFISLILVVAIFALLVAQSFVATPPVATSSIFFIFLAVVFGWLYHRGTIGLWGGSIIFVPILFYGIFLGIQFPCDLTVLLGFTAAQAKMFWVIFLLIYAFLASVLPVWILLQPRDYLNSYLLYSMLILGFVSILVAQPALNMPGFTGLIVANPENSTISWPLFPILFVTIACGACSGFHGLVCSGTTAKQISNETHARPIGYGAMIVEGLVAIITLISIAGMSRSDFINSISAKGAVTTFSNSLANLAAHLGLPVETGQTFISLTISAFILTTLDTATRLTRFIIYELNLPEAGKPQRKKMFNLILENRFSATLLVVMLSGYLALSGEASAIWPVFGASNQLLAALTLLVVTFIFIKERKKFWIVLLPFLFMLIMSSWALTALFIANLKSQHWALCTASALLICVTIGLMILAGKKLNDTRTRHNGR